jgi:hypothetical protein
MHAQRQHVHATILRYVSHSEARRQEAIREYLLVMQPEMPVAAMNVFATKTPPLLPDLYNKWIGMFVDRLFETLPPQQIELVCDGAEDNNAALVLAYIMFLESERMEKQIEEDLENSALSGEQASAMAGYVTQEMARINQDARKTMQEKAERYRSKHEKR